MAVVTEWQLAHFDEHWDRRECPSISRLNSLLRDWIACGLLSTNARITHKKNCRQDYFPNVAFQYAAFFVSGEIMRYNFAGVHR